MSDVQSVLAGHAEDLRRAFDRSFAEPVAGDVRQSVDFISLRLGGDLHAARMSQIDGLFAAVKVTPCPSPLAELVGIAGFRGALTPVYDLAQLLGYARSAGRWTILTADRAVALAFDDFEGHFRVEPSAIAGSHSNTTTRYVHQIARSANSAWPIVDIPSVVAAITARATTATS